MRRIESSNVILSPHPGAYRRFRDTGALPRLCGTVYYDGAGMRSAYIPAMVEALSKVGIANVQAANRRVASGGVLRDVIGILKVGRASSRYAIDPGEVNERLLNLNDFAQFAGVEEATAPVGGAPQFNLIGYSHGSLMAARFAYAYVLLGGRVDHLVLVASPIRRDFLALLESHANIRCVYVKSLGELGDPIMPGMSLAAIYRATPRLLHQFMGKPTVRNIRRWGRLEPAGHFYYLPLSPEGDRRRRELAEEIAGIGVT